MTEALNNSRTESPHAFAGLGLPAVILLLVCAVALLVLPVLPIDETRYLGVAWEMYHSGSFVVPLQNGLPYSHKPPMLFWLIHAGWSLFGVNAVTPRLTVCAVGIFCLFLLRGISLRLWPGDRRAASRAALVLSSMIIWMIWSSAIMFDVLMTCWVLVCVQGMLDAAVFARKRGWLLLALGVAGGILTKGPVIFVYVLPLVLLHRFQAGWKWRLRAALLAACVLGLALSLLWVIPAVIHGGDVYKHALLWSQTVDRVGESFSHQRPFWWYLPVLPALLLPWLFYRPAWRGTMLKNADPGTRMALIWVVVPFLIFSAISCKQVQYLIPILPAAALLMGRNIAREEQAREGTARVHGVSARRLAMASALLVALLVLGVGLSVMKGYDLQGMAQAIRQNLDAGRPVAYAGKYHGQFHFLGRLQGPLMVLPGGATPQEIKDFFKQHPDGLIVSNLGRRHRLPDGAVVVYQQRFRMRQTLFLWGSAPAHRAPADSHP